MAGRSRQTNREVSPAASTPMNRHDERERGMWYDRERIAAGGIESIDMDVGRGGHSSLTIRSRGADQSLMDALGHMFSTVLELGPGPALPVLREVSFQSAIVPDYDARIGRFAGPFEGPVGPNLLRSRFNRPEEMAKIDLQFTGRIRITRSVPPHVLEELGGVMRSAGQSADVVTYLNSIWHRYATEKLLRLARHAAIEELQTQTVTGHPAEEQERRRLIDVLSQAIGSDAYQVSREQVVAWLFATRTTRQIDDGPAELRVQSLLAYHMILGDRIDQHESAAAARRAQSVSRRSRRQDRGGFTQLTSEIITSSYDRVNIDDFVTALTRMGERMGMGFGSYLTDPNPPEAQAKGMALLRESLTPEQLKSYDKDQWFLVKGGTSGKTYRIRHGTQLNIDILDTLGRKYATMCFMPMGNLVTGDVLVAQKIALETSETDVLRIANITRG